MQGPLVSLAELFPIGLSSTFRKTVTMSMIKAYGDMVGDDDPIHFDEAFCKRTIYGRPIAHGSLLIGFMSAASTAATRDLGIPLVSLGYDRVRLIAPVFAGDETVTRFTVVSHDDARRRVSADVKVHVEDRLVALATNVIKLVN